ncbi:MAG: hypothetical protein ACP5G2_07565 [Candidatus Bipolaricaulaceae bacterium]
MKRLVGCLAVVMLLAVPVLASFSAAELEKMATKDVIPEIRMAAGLALADYYAANKTAAELEALAKTGETAAIRSAAGLALERKYIGGKKTRAQLLAQLIGGATPELRGAAVSVLQEYFFTLSGDDLMAYVRSGTNPEVRYAAAKAYFFRNRSKFARADLEAICKDTANADGYRKAAAELLAGTYLFPFNTALSQAELEAQALEGENEYLRKAAAIALTNLLIKSDMTETELYKKVVSFFLDDSLSEEYKWAYERALAARWAAGLAG